MLLLCPPDLRLMLRGQVLFSEIQCRAMKPEQSPGCCVFAGVCMSELVDHKVGKIFPPSASFLKGRAGSDLFGGFSSFTKLTYNER